MAILKQFSTLFITLLAVCKIFQFLLLCIIFIAVYSNSMFSVHMSGAIVCIPWLVS